MNMNEFGLDKESFDFIFHTIGNYADIDEAVIFGSRAMGNFKPISDIDIALKGDLKGHTAGSLSEFLNNAAPFLYKVDVLDYNKIDNAELRKHIDDLGKVIFKRART